MTKKKRPVARHDQKEMFPLVEKWLSSGEKQGLFCKKAGFSQDVFKYWLGRYRRQQQATTSDFVAVSVPPPGPNSGRTFARLSFPDGRELRFESAVGAGFLRELLGC